MIDPSLAAVVHDLRAPLSSIRLIAEYLLTEKEQEVDHFLRMIEDEVLRMSEMLENVLEMARLNSGAAKQQWSTVRAEIVCHEAIDVVRPLAVAKRLDISVNVEPVGLSFNCDRHAIRRLLVNLLSNAIRHTSAGGVTVHATQNESLGHRHVVFEVADTGEGIPAPAMKTLGKPFASNRSRQAQLTGAGLGLAICKSIVAMHDGCMSVRSAENHGSTFNVTLSADLPGPEPMQCFTEIESH